jgi:pimeloyl-ACP methyl ester carboxylesterase
MNQIPAFAGMTLEEKMKVTWHKFEGVEAQVFEPEAGAHAAILFCPGFPGMGGAMFEQRHAAALTDEGYAVYVLKHKGTKLSGALAPVMVNNASRLMAGRKANETHIGGGSATIDEWLEEPFKALKVLHTAYEAIHIIGNSFGALAALWSITEPGAMISKVKSLLLYAGAQGVNDGTEDSVMRIWQPEFLMAERIVEKVTLNDPFDIVASLGKVYLVLPERVRALPLSVAISYLVVERDEILRLSDTEQFNEAIGGRGTIFMNTYDRGWLEHGLLAHDTPDYTTEDLLDLIR